MKYDSFASLISGTRKLSGLTLQAFGKAIGLSKPNLCDIEKGRTLVSVKQAMKIAKRLGIEEEIAIQACLQDQVNKVGIRATVICLKNEHMSKK